MLSTTFLTNPSIWDRWATNWKLVGIIYKVPCSTCETKILFLWQLTVDMHQNYFQKMITLQKVEPFWRWWAFTNWNRVLDKRSYKTFSSVWSTPLLCHIFLSSVHVEHYPIDEFGIISLYKFLWLHTPKFKQLLFIVWMVYLWRL